MYIQIHRVKLTIFISFLLAVLLLTSGFAQIPSSREEVRKTKTTGEMFVTSAGIGPLGETYIVLYWNPVEGATGYNLYRREKVKMSLPKLPLNGKKPISSVKTCDELKAIVPEGSQEWEMLENAFSSLLVKEKTSGKGEKAERLNYFSGRLLQEKDFKDEQSSKKEKKKKVTEKGVIIDKKILDPSLGIGIVSLDYLLLSVAVDPCTALERGLTAEEEKIFDVLAAANLKLRLARGLGFIDYDVKAHKRYVYELRGINSSGKEFIIAQNVEVWAGHFVLPGPPSNFTVTPGDNMVLATWDRRNDAFSYKMRRATSPGGPYYVVNDEPIVYDIETDLEGNKIDPPRPGFVDFQRWSDDGAPVSHEVNGVDIHGPENYDTYYYQVASCDILGREGNWSSYESAMPEDKTSPKTPSDFNVDSSASGLTLSWRKITRDINSHQEQDTTHTYKIYRSDSLENLEDISSLSSYLVHSLTANPQNTTTMTLTWMDTDLSTLVPTYGEKDFWYRIQCEDAHGNISSPSAAISGRVPDTTSPGPTHVTGADGYEDHIKVMWDPNTEPDLAGYQIYRSICDMGTPYQPEAEKDDKRLPCDFVLIGEILKKEAEERLANTGSIYYDDFSVPEGSPVCYAYWVRAFDMARNVYEGYKECPANPYEYTCQRLYEETPPEAPIISALKAKNNAVLIEWISSPVQDLRAFHVYRSKKENDTPTFIACVFKDGTVKSDKWRGMKPDCNDIPAEADPTTVQESYTDKNLEPNQIFWYRVSALDWLGNESEGDDITKIPAISTFTYSKDLPATPTVLPPSGSTEDGCGLIVCWEPTYNPAEIGGFIVFRSTSETGTYRQVSPIVKGNEFTDKSAIKGVSYWYRIQAIDKSGKLSEPSAAVQYSY